MPNPPTTDGASAIQAPSVILLGAPGSGKTYSITTLAEAGLEVFVISTEPTGLETLLDAWEAKKLPLSQLHYATLTPSRMGIDGLAKLAQTISLSDHEGIAKLKPMGDRQNSKFRKLLELLRDFKCERTGQAYGSVESFGPERVLVIDSLSGINLMAKDLVVGDKPNMSPGEWGTAMNVIEQLLLNLCSNLKCILVITAHMEREENEITGARTIMISTLGRKLAPKIPRFFSEVVMTYREAVNYFWSTNALNVDLKHRALKLDGKLSPSFVPIVEAYHRRLSYTGANAPKKIATA